MILLLAFAQVAGLEGCALPRSAPSEREFAHAGAEHLIDLVEPTLQDAIDSRPGPPTGFPPVWRASPAILANTIGPGDILSVTVFERDGLNLFPVGSNGGDTITGLTVERDGAIRLPLVGQVQVAGLTPMEARRPLLYAMRHLAVSPDVEVAIVEKHSHLVSVQGDVMKPGVVPLAPESNRLLTLVGSAAPTQADLELATVTVRRHGQSATMRLSDIYDQPQQNIAMRDDDVVIVRSRPLMVDVLGTAGQQSRVRITRPGYSVLDAINDARGLNDQTANPAAVYLMRLSDRAMMRSSIPRVYHFDFRNPAQIAVASAFVVRDGDAVVISDAPFTQAAKILSAFSTVLTTARSATEIN